MKFYNTLTRTKEEFTPIEPGKVKIYSCGPTVYSFAHIGNLRTYIFTDLLRRTLKWNGYELLHVMNITDVGHLTSDGDSGEDKMEKSAREQKKSPYDIAKFYTDVFMADLDKLHIDKPEIFPRATDNIPEMIEFVKKLLDLGYGYETSDGIYFDIGKFPSYGKLSRLNLDEQIAGARVEVNDEKRHPADFALWKKAPKEHIMQWPSPWGMGYPGWHIECSVMGLKYLGETFDIHTGGVDHIPIHHENEIAQSECCLGHKVVNTWMHSDFMLVNNGKMSKSLHNTYTVSELEERGYSPLVFRYFCLNAHYHSKLNFTFEAMDSAKKSLANYRAAAARHKGGCDNVSDDVIKNFKDEFTEAINDDLNIPKALGIAWNAAKYEAKSQKIFDLLGEFDKVLALDYDKPDEEKTATVDADLDKKIRALIDERNESRKNKNYARADEIRNELKEMGVLIEDTKDGTTYKLI